MADTSFLKKFGIPSFSFDFLKGKPSRLLGIDIGGYSAKVVQLRYESDRAILETYGELLSEGYLKGRERAAGGFLRYSDNDIAECLKDLLFESEATAREAVVSIPASATFIVLIKFPRISHKEVEEAMPYEARKYIPIPISEVMFDWDILEEEGDGESLVVLLVAVQREWVEKVKRIVKGIGLGLYAVEAENFSLIRSLVGHDDTPTAIINFGYQTTSLTIVDRGRIRLSHLINRGSQEQTRALENGLGINTERAEKLKREVGLSERIEEREITSILTPLVEFLLTDIERSISLYNRKAARKIQRINLTGGGANLKGLVDYTATKLGLETKRGNPFARIVTPPAIQPVIYEIGPSFAVAAGLALRGIVSR